jgi:hypothetical protein
VKHPDPDAILANYPDAISFRGFSGKTRWRKRTYFDNGRWSEIDLPGQPGDGIFHCRYHGIGDGIPPRDDKPPALPWRPRIPEEREIERMVKAARHRSKVMRWPFDIDAEWVVEQCRKQGWACALTGVRFSFAFSDRRKRLYAPSIDRIDCKGGYTKDNVRIIIVLMNIALNDFGIDLFDEIAAIRLNWKSRSSGDAHG